MQNRAIPHTPFALLALSLCALWAFACGIPLPCPPLAQAQPSPTPIVVLAHAIPRPPPSVEQRIVHSDAIVLVRPPAVAGEIRTLPSADKCVAPTYLPVITFQFPVTVYIKGGGGDALFVEWQFGQARGFEDGHTYPTKQEAHDALAARLEHRDAALESRDALLFLQIARRSSESASEVAATYKFTTLDDKPWLPLAVATQPDAAPAYLLDSNPADGAAALPTISLAELRASAEAVAALLKQGEGIEGYKTCMKWRLDDENDFARNPPELQEPFTDEISSGLIQRIPIHSERGGWQTSLGLVNWHAEGPDAEYFQIQVTDQWPALPGNDIDSDLAPVSYLQRYATTRPLPMGVYRFVPRHHDRDERRICRPIPVDDWIPWEVTAVAPAGTLHEAFFDPVADGAAIAAGGSLGALNPATFATANGATETTIRRIEWASNKATITLANPPASLADHHAEFIALDGSLALRLDFDNASSAATHDALALSWQVCAQPWQPGDLLMLRITKTRFDSGNSATYRTGCQN